MKRYLLHGIATILLSTMAVLGPGCGDDDDVGGTAGAAGAAGAGGAGGAAGSTMADSGAPTQLTHLQVLSVLHLANQSEISEGQLAIERAVNEDVREFANMMVTEHTAADQAMMSIFSSDPSLLADAGLGPDGQPPLATSPVSEALTAQTSLQDQMLQMKTGPSFDLAYMTGQVALHGELVQTIDTVLLPSVQNATFRDQILEFRGTVVDHAERALDVLNDLVGD